MAGKPRSFGAAAVGRSDCPDVPYDRLVLATGSRPFVPPIAGAEGPGAFVIPNPWDLGSARVLGLDSVIGSLEPDKAADIIAVDLSDLTALPLYDLASHLVYNNRRSPVTHSWVAGRPLLVEGRLTSLNEADIRSRAQYWQSRISRGNS